MKATKRSILGVICATAGVLLLMAWFLTTPKFLDAENSPHGVYRLEFYKASPLQRFLNPDFKMPFVLRLYRAEPKKLLGESSVVDLWLDGEVTWLLDPPMKMQKVRVGSSVVFRDIPPECTDFSQIPSCPRVP